MGKQKYKYDYISGIGGFFELCALILTALPYYYFNHESVCYFDLIKYFPSLGGIFALLSVFFMIITPIFAIIAIIPRIVCSTTSALAFIASLMTFIHYRLYSLGGKLTLLISGGILVLLLLSTVLLFVAMMKE